jgi:hypothetical protein
MHPFLQLPFPYVLACLQPEHHQQESRSCKMHAPYRREFNKGKKSLFFFIIQNLNLVTQIVLKENLIWRALKGLYEFFRFNLYCYNIKKINILIIRIYL